MSINRSNREIIRDLARRSRNDDTHNDDDDIQQTIDETRRTGDETREDPRSQDRRDLTREDPRRDTEEDLIDISQHSVASEDQNQPQEHLTSTPAATATPSVRFASDDQPQDATPGRGDSKKKLNFDDISVIASPAQNLPIIRSARSLGQESMEAAAIVYQQEVIGKFLKAIRDNPSYIFENPELGQLDTSKQNPQENQDQTTS